MNWIKTHKIRPRYSSSKIESKVRLPINRQTTRYQENRANEISLTRIKHKCSSLNADLNRVNIVPVLFAAVE